MPDDDKLNTILIHVGETRKGITGLEAAVNNISKEVVRRPECTERHVVVATSIGALKEDLNEIRQDVKAIRRTTGQGHQAITQTMLELSEDKKKGLKYWIGVGVGAITILSFLGSIFYGVVSLGRYIERIDSLARKAEKSNAEIKRAFNRATAAPYSRFYLPDAGAKSIKDAD